MKFQYKLITLVAGTTALILLSVATALSLQAPREQLQSEERGVHDLQLAASDLQTITAGLLLRPLETQKDQLLAGLERLRSTQQAAIKSELLAALDTKVADSLKATQDLATQADSELAALLQRLNQLDLQSQQWGVAPASAGLTQWVQAALVRKARSSEVLAAVTDLTGRVAKASDAVSALRGGLESARVQVASELERLRQNNSNLGLGLIALAVVFSLGFAFLFARNVTQTLKTLGATVTQVGHGDLRIRVASKRRDEWGTLGRALDGFLDSLSDSVLRIQSATAENQQVKESLASSVSLATSSAVEISANSESIVKQLKKADERIQISQGDLNMVVILQEAFVVRLQGQNQGVAESTQAVNDLAQGIARITDLSLQNRQAVEALLSEADRGREVFDRSFAKVAEINDSVSAIQEMVVAIADIAGQTNILALNAAIEAAHAGEAGKGFAVVADEISKLAAASAASSSQIAQTIQEVVAKIREAGATRGETLGAFAAIGTQIDKVSVQGRGIYDAADSMNQGTDRIRQVMETVSTNASEITKEADRVGSVATKLGDTLGQVGRISNEVVSNIGEITVGLQDITRTVSEVGLQAERLDKVGQSLHWAVNTFQTHDSHEGVEDLVPHDEVLTDS